MGRFAAWGDERRTGRPAELDTIADFQKFPPLLKSRGYTDPDIAGIMPQNALYFFTRTLPQTAA